MDVYKTSVLLVTTANIVMGIQHPVTTAQKFRREEHLLYEKAPMLKLNGHLVNGKM